MALLSDHGPQDRLWEARSVPRRDGSMRATQELPIAVYDVWAALRASSRQVFLGAVPLPGRQVLHFHFTFIVLIKFSHHRQRIPCVFALGSLCVNSPLAVFC